MSGTIYQMAQAMWESERCGMPMTGTPVPDRYIKLARVAKNTIEGRRKNMGIVTKKFDRMKETER